MDVFHVFKIVGIVQNRAKHHICIYVAIRTNITYNVTQEEQMKLNSQGEKFNSVWNTIFCLTTLLLSQTLQYIDQRR